MCDSAVDSSDWWAQQSTVNMQLRGTFDPAPRDIGTHWVPLRESERSQPKHDMTERIMTFAEDQMPEETLLIGFS